MGAAAALGLREVAGRSIAAQRDRRIHLRRPQRRNQRSGQAIAASISACRSTSAGPAPTRPPGNVIIPVVADVIDEVSRIYGQSKRVIIGREWSVTVRDRDRAVIWFG